MNQLTLQAINQLTSGIKAMSGEAVEQNVQLKLSSLDQAKLAQSKATKATENGSEPSKENENSAQEIQEEKSENSGGRTLNNEPLSQRVKSMFPGFFGGALNETKLEGLGKKIISEQDLVLFNDRVTLDKLETEVKPPELALMEKEESYDIFSVSPSLINFENELDINEANELAITRRIYMN
jgi:hypothetical protein